MLESLLFSLLSADLTLFSFFLSDTCLSLFGQTLLVTSRVSSDLLVSSESLLVPLVTTLITLKELLLISQSVCFGSPLTTFSQDFSVPFTIGSLVPNVSFLQSFSFDIDPSPFILVVVLPDFGCVDLSPLAFDFCASVNYENCDILI